MGFAKILWSTNTSIPNGETKRFHLCANNPCAVVWPSGKYGVYGPPIHLQQIDEPPELAAFAEAPPASESAPIPLPPISESAPIPLPAPPSPPLALPPLQESLAADDSALPLPLAPLEPLPPPKTAVLKTLEPAEPAPPIVDGVYTKKEWCLHY